MLIDPANIFGNFRIPHVHFCKIGKSMLLNLSLLSARCHQYHKALALRNKSRELSNQQVDPERQMCSSSEADHIHSMLCTVIFKVHILCFLMKEMLPCPQVSSDRCSLQLKPLQPTRDVCSGFPIPCAVQFFWYILASVSLFS